MINDLLGREFLFYRRCFLKSLLLVVMIALLLLAADRQWSLGFFVGGVASFINIAALAFAYLRIAVQKKPLAALFWPLGSFLAMCGMALLLVVKFTPLLLGFAVGLTTPLIFGVLVTFMAQNPLDQRAE